jgi:hypothetical protein
MYKLNYKILISLLVVGLSANISAEVINTPKTKKTNYSVQLPGRGMSKEMVLKTFGKPLAKTNAVGKPPISSWTYTMFTVYFESDYVIHAVVTK